MNIEYKKLWSATNILGRFLLRSSKLQNRKWHGRNSAGAVIKLPRHVYSPNSEASVSNDGKIPGFCKFLFLSSVIKFDNEMSEVKTKITIALFDIANIRADHLPRSIRNCTWDQGFLDIWPPFRTLAVLLDKILNLPTKTWPPYWSLFPLATFRDTLMTVVDAV